MNRKGILLIFDGLGDAPVAALGHRTPLEAADTPVLDRLAGSGQFGMVDPIEPGVIPNTHTGCGALFGVFPDDLQKLRRGPLEASGAGRILQPGEVAVRANFATLETEPGGLRIADRRAGRISEDTAELAEALGMVDLGDGIVAELQPTDQHRCVLVLSGQGLDARVGDTDPGDQAMPSRVASCHPLVPEAAATAEKINRFIEEAHRRLSAHPLNRARMAAGKFPATGVITRGAGSAYSLDNVLHGRGVSAAVVAGCNTVLGLSRTLGLEVKTDPRFTAAANTDLPAKMETALAALEVHDLVYVHVKAPDLFAHDLQPENKRNFLELCDESLDTLDKAGVLVALAADHSTDSNTGAHTADPIPALLYDPAEREARPPARINFGEQACSDGNMPRQSSHELLLKLLNRMGF